jgi:hypothetical protein
MNGQHSRPSNPVKRICPPGPSPELPQMTPHPTDPTGVSDFSFFAGASKDRQRFRSPANQPRPRRSPPESKQQHSPPSAIRVHWRPFAVQKMRSGVRGQGSGVRRQASGVKSQRSEIKDPRSDVSYSPPFAVGPADPTGVSEFSFFAEASKDRQCFRPPAQTSHNHQNPSSNSHPLSYSRPLASIRGPKPPSSFVSIRG